MFYIHKNETIKGYVDAIILSVIAKGDSYGYQIAKCINEESEHALELKEGTLYPALRRLEADKYIEGYWGTDREGPRRRYYRITKLGQAKLAASRTAWQKNKKMINLFLGEAYP